MCEGQAHGHMINLIRLLAGVGLGCRRGLPCSTVAVQVCWTAAAGFLCDAGVVVVMMVVVVLSAGEQRLPQLCPCLPVQLPLTPVCGAPSPACVQSWQPCACEQHVSQQRQPPTSLPCAASAKASCDEKVLLPTPPLPDSTRTLCFTCLSRSLMAATSAAAQPGARVMRCACCCCCCWS